MKRVWFKNSRDQKLVGVLHEAGKEKAVILLHGFGEDKNETGIFIRMAEALRKNGFTALRFDFAGSGESQGEFSEMSFTSEVQDMESAIGFMKNLGYSKFGLIGQSFGGAVSILGFSKDIKAMVLWNPVARMESFENYLSLNNKNWEEEVEKGGFSRIYKKSRNSYVSIGRPLFTDIKRLDLLSEAGKISCPVLVIHGDKDSVLPWENSLELLNVLKEPKKLEIIKGAEHAFHEKASGKIVIPLTVNWFRKYL